MKKLAICLLCILLAGMLCACNSAESEQAIVRKNKETVQPAAAGETEAAEPAEETGLKPFSYMGQNLIMGAALDISTLPEPESVYEAPSCAIEGTDLVYGYGSFELGAFDDGSGPVISSVYFLSPDAVTAEGLMLGDQLSRMIELYGANYEQVGTAYTYRQEDTVLSIIVQNDVVIAIEYRLLMPELG